MERCLGEQEEEEDEGEQEEKEKEEENMANMENHNARYASQIQNSEQRTES